MKVLLIVIIALVVGVAVFNYLGSQFTEPGEPYKAFALIPIRVYSHIFVNEGDVMVNTWEYKSCYILGVYTRREYTNQSYGTDNAGLCSGGFNFR